jgi:MoxR-like ATPase
MSDKEIVSLVNTCTNHKPSDFVISDLYWKMLVRNVVTGSNIMMTGPAGTGKTMVVEQVAKVLKRPIFKINLGATQDPRSALIGNVQYQEGRGTYFIESGFAKAIQTPGTIVLLDEFSRANHEAANILMTVLDAEQRYVRLDEEENTRVIKVAPGVCFIATANIGNEFTGTRTIDRAMMDRFAVVPMIPLDLQGEVSVLRNRFPSMNIDVITAVASVAVATREELLTASPKIDVGLSTRATIQWCSYINHGFTFMEAAEAAVFQRYEDDGTADSPRSYVKSIVQGKEPKQKNSSAFSGKKNGTM